jgi:hypothetical protein
VTGEEEEDEDDDDEKRDCHRACHPEPRNGPNAGEAWMNVGIILSEAKDRPRTIDHRKKILRFAQDDT